MIDHFNHFKTHIMAKFISLLAFSCIFLNLHAQVYKYGLRVGTNVTTNSGLTTRQNLQGGIHFGVFGQMKATDLIGVQVEGLISVASLKKGAIFNNYVSSLSLLNFNSIHVPVLLNITPTPSLTIQVGPQFGSTIFRNPFFLMFPQILLKRTDFSMVTGVQFNLSKWNIFGRYSLGLSEIRKIPTTQDRWSSRMIQAGVGISL